MKLKRPDELKLNIMVGVLSEAMYVVINFLTKQALKMQLGTAYLGIQTVYGNFSDLLVFAFSGFGIAMLYQLYRPVAANDPEKCAAVFQFFNRYYRIWTIVALAAGVAFTGLVVWSINVNIAYGKIILFYFMYLTGTMLSNRAAICRYYMMAFQKRYVAVSITSGTDLAALIAQLYVLYALKNYTLFLMLVILKNLFSGVILTLLLKIKYPYLESFKGSSLSAEEKKSGRSNMLNMMVSKVGSILSYSTDSMLISGLVSTVTAGCYSNYYFLCTGLQNALTALFDSIMSWIGKSIVVDSREEQIIAYRRMCMIDVLVTCIGICGFYTLCEDFIRLWMGNDVLLSQTTAILISVNLFMNAMRGTVGMYRQSAGLFAKVSWCILIRGIFNILLSIILGLQWGLTGIILATTISDIITVYWFEPYIVYQFYKRSFLFEILYQLKGAFLTITAVLVTKFLLSGITINSWLGLIWKGILTVLIAGVWSGLWVLMGQWLGRKTPVR